MIDTRPSTTSSVSNRRRILIIGGGSAGISVAARLCRAGQRDVTVIEPSATHYFQPAWSLVGGGATAPEATARPTKSVIPRGARWVQDRVTAIDADEQTVNTESSGEIKRSSRSLDKASLLVAPVVITCGTSGTVPSNSRA